MTVSQLSGQTQGRSNSELRSEVGKILKEAQKAMKEGNLDKAELLVSRAEAMKVEYDPLTARFQYTPEKARRQLDQLKKSDRPGPPSASRGSQFTPEASRPINPTTATDPFAQSTLNQQAEQPRRGELSKTPNAESLLIEARKALARRDIATAERLAVRAAQSGESDSLHGDSPERIKALIDRIKLLSTEPREFNSAELAREQSHSLMEQAEWLMHYGELNLAESMARDAQKLGASYNAFERTPEKLLAQIAKAKSTANSSVPGQLIVTSNRTPSAEANGAFAAAKPLERQESAKKAQASSLLAKARFALDRDEFSIAEQYLQKALELNVPENQFGENETRPWELRLEIDSAKNRRNSGVRQANFVEVDGRSGVRPAQFEQSAAPAIEEDDSAPPARTPTEIAPTPALSKASANGRELYEQGMTALQQRDTQTAVRHFRAAWQHRDQLDRQQQETLRDKLNLLQGNAQAAPPASRQPSPLDQLDEEQRVQVQRLFQEVSRERAIAEDLKNEKKDPRGALQRLQQLRDRVSQSQVDPAARKHLLTIVENKILEIQRYIEDHVAEIENDERNRATLAEIEGGRKRKYDVENKLAELVDKFNELVEENRTAEAEVVARQANELDPENPVVQTLMWKAKFIRRVRNQMDINDKSEDGFAKAMESAEESKIPFDDRNPLQFDKSPRWEQLSQTRREWLREQRSRYSVEEMKILQALKNEQVHVRFNDTPLSDVLHLLGESAGVNIHIDQRGLIAEGHSTDTPVSLELNQPVMLKSALSLILEPLHLSYVVQHEVIKVTSEQLKDENVFPKTYYVADLVIPIPNFVPSYNMGLPGALAHAHSSLGYGGNVSGSGNGVPLTVAANNDITNPVTNNPQVLANLQPGSLMGSARSQSIPGMPGGMGGGPVADFDSLIELITTTVSPESWDEVGGPGSISGFETNLSLVVSQTQEVHEEIAELLEQLRRLQDLQVTIEVRFITLNDNFFERIGVDFDFNINDNSGFVGDGMGGFATPPGPPNDNNAFLSPTPVIGLDALGTPTGNLDLSFVQDSFTAAIPAFGGFNPATAANFGFAILSDIEVFFLLQAATGDTRSNVLQAPKVTLFNGQFAFVADASQRPFVTSVIPVVGDFAAAHQPVIVVLSEGTSLSVQAVVSSDRRFVRLTLVPYFSSIGNVQEFTFTGKKISGSSTVVPDATGSPTSDRNTTAEVVEGITLQLPTFNFTTVVTTVSVPDGGTVLMGGIKRLQEGRNESGVPILSQVPYINRLFKNVGIGRTTQSLMMMVTPRIIIQEEEEREQTGLDSSQL